MKSNFEDIVLILPKNRFDDTLFLMFSKVFLKCFQESSQLLSFTQQLKYSPIVKLLKDCLLINRPCEQS